MRKNLFWLASVALALVACNDDAIDETADNKSNEPTNEEASGAELADDLKVYPLLYNNYISDDDVEITASDTSSIVVKNELLDALKVKLESGDVISVWTSRNDIPFMRRVVEVNKEGSNVRLHTENIGLDEVLKEAHLEFDSQIYTNLDETPRNADGTINDRFYLSENDGVYHPTALWYHSEEEDARLRGETLTRAAADDGDVLKLGYDNERTIIVEDLGPTRGSVDLGVKFSATVTNLTRPIVLDNDTIAKIGLQNAKFAFSGGLHARLDCSLWNGVERFEVGPYYSIEGNLKAGISMSSDLFKLKEEYTIAECQGFTSCFWVGPVPVVVSFTPSLMFGAELNGKATGSIGANVTFKGSHHTYACYDYRDGWHLDEGGEDFTYSVDPYAGGSLSVEFQTGLYAKAAVSLYGVAGPTLSAGPYFKASAEASVDQIKSDIAAKVTASVGLGGAVGAQLKVWSWSLAKWEVNFNLLEKKILDKSFSLQEWLKEIEKASEIMPTGDASEDWEAKQAEVEKEQRYQDDLDNIIGDNEKALKRFIHYMDPAFGYYTEETWYADHSDVVADWKQIKEQGHTFYNWNMEFALWECMVTENTEMMQSISEHIAKDTETKMGILKDVLPAKIRIAFEHAVIGCDMEVVQALENFGIPTEQALVEDLQNIRDERQKHLEYGRMTGTYNQEMQRDYFTPWYQTFVPNTK